MRRRVLLLIAIGAVGCGGDDGGDGSAGTTAAAPQPAGAATAPPPKVQGQANPTSLPTDTNGATAVQGTFAMRVADETKHQDYFAVEDAIDWETTTACAETCTVTLRQELPAGGSTTVELEQIGPTQYAYDGTGTYPCLNTDTPSKRRISISVKRQIDQDGIPVATQIQGFVRDRVTCGGVAGEQQAVARLQGEVAAQGGAAQQGTVPTAPPPQSTNGATAVQGSFSMRVLGSHDHREYYAVEDERLTWRATTACEPECVVTLRRENPNGGFTTLELTQAGPSTYARDGTATITCAGREVPTRTRTTIRVRAKAERAGVPTATEIDGLVRERFACRGEDAPGGRDVPQVDTARLRGTVDAP